MAYYSLEMKLDDVVKDSGLELTILENIRRCSKIVGKTFKVIFWHENLTEQDCKDFVERNEHLLFEVHTQLSKGPVDSWFIIYSYIDKDKIKHISKLARISLDAKKTDTLAKDLSSIFKFIEQLNELNTDKTEPLSSNLNEPLRSRGDVVNDGKIREKILENSPQKNEEFFVVPKVIE